MYLTATAGLLFTLDLGVGKHNLLKNSEIVPER
jgi:hypothetical protein